MYAYGSGAAPYTMSVVVAPLCEPGQRYCENYCATCPVDTLGIGHTCEGTACVVGCEPGTLLCQNACAPCATGSTSVECDGAACRSTECDTGYWLDNGSCVPWRVHRFYFPDFPSIENVTLSVSSTGQPYIVASHLYNECVLLHREQGSWQQEVLHDSAFVCLSAMDGINRLHVVMQTSDAMIYRLREGTTWTEETVHSGTLEPLDLAVGPDGMPYVVTKSGGVLSAWSPGSPEWRSTPILFGDTEQRTYGSHVSLAVDAMGYLNMAYSYRQLGAAIATHSAWTYWSYDYWNYEPAIDGIGLGLALAVDSGWMQHLVAYSDSGRFHYRSFDANAYDWQRSCDHSDTARIQLDADDEATVLYECGDSLELLRRDQDQWLTGSVVEGTGSTCSGDRHVALDLDSSGTPHIAWIGSGCDLHYATW